MSFDEAFEIFVKRMKDKILEKEVKHGNFSLLKTGVYKIDRSPITRHFWEEIQEAASDCNNPDEFVDVSNMAFFEFWWLEENCQNE